MHPFRTLAVFLACALYLSSCQKEVSFDNTSPGGNTGGNTGGNSGGNNNASCNDVVMKLKRYQALFSPDHFIEASWNSNGTIQSITYNTPLSELRNATYIYENDRIKEAVLRTNFDNQVYDTAVFHYNADGKVDSMYLKNDNWFNIALSYNNGKLVKYSRYTGTSMMFYWDVTTDTKGNITNAIEYWGESTGFVKQSTMTFTRDDRKNPLAVIAPYMFYLDDDYNIFWYWGPNNYTDQRYQDHTGTGIDLTTGFKFKYNDNCYPASSQNTIMGQILFTDDDFSYTYY